MFTRDSLSDCAFILYPYHYHRRVMCDVLRKKKRVSVFTRTCLASRVGDLIFHMILLSSLAIGVAILEPF